MNYPSTEVLYYTVRRCKHGIDLFHVSQSIVCESFISTAAAHVGQFYELRIPRELSTVGVLLLAYVYMTIFNWETII